LFVYDFSQGLTHEDKEVLELIKNKKHPLIANKSDLVSSTPHLNPLTTVEEVCLFLSALTGKGIQELKQELTKQICDINPENLDFVTNTRQQECLKKARNSIEQALIGSQIRQLQDLISIDVKTAILALDELTGELITDDILNNIFDNFCIGK